MSELQLTYLNKLVAIRFTVSKQYDLIADGYDVNDLLLAAGVLKDRFCAAWAIMLEVEYNGDVEGFLSGFNNIRFINPYLLNVMERDGLINTDKPDDATASNTDGEDIFPVKSDEDDNAKKKAVKPTS